MSAVTRRRGLIRIFAVPAILAVLTIFGLTSGILGDGIWDAISWIALGIPIAVVVFHLCRSSARERRHEPEQRAAGSSSY